MFLAFADISVHSLQPFGGFESSSQQRGGQSCGHSEHLGGPCSYGGQQQQWGAQHQGQQYKGWGGPSGEWSQYESQQRGPQQSGRWSEDREERGLSGRGEDLRNFTGFV